MKIFSGNSINELYPEILKNILSMGCHVKPRDKASLELVGPCCVVLNDISRNVLTINVRKASLTFMAAEFLWIMTGREDVAMIAQYNKAMAQFSDNGIDFFGAYGPKIRGQLSYVVNSLVKDPFTRQAVMTIWRESPPGVRDVPCTVMLHFIRRPVDVLNLIVYMRSQDAWLGLPYDVHNFTSLQSMVASMLKIRQGSFTLVQGSLHLYTENLEIATKLLGDEPSWDRLITPVSDVSSLESLHVQLAVVDKIMIMLMQGEWENISPLLEHVDDPLLLQKLGWIFKHHEKRRLDNATSKPS